MKLLDGSKLFSEMTDCELNAGGVYLICFDKPFYHARHYIGWSGSIHKRLFEHSRGNGAALLRAVKRHGIGWRVVRFWPGADRNRERQLKNCKAVPRLLCPLCREKATSK